MVNALGNSPWSSSFGTADMQRGQRLYTVLPCRTAVLLIVVRLKTVNRSRMPPNLCRTTTHVCQYQPTCRQRKRVRRDKRLPLLHDTPAVAAMQAVKPAKDLKAFLGNSLRQHGPFSCPPPSGKLDSGWEVTRYSTLLCTRAVLTYLMTFDLSNNAHAPTTASSSVLYHLRSIYNKR